MQKKIKSSKLRKTTRPTSAHCTLPKYMGFLIAEPKSLTCTRLAEVTDISHDSVNRFLNREDYQPKDMFNEVKNELQLTGGVLSVDDTVLDKPYSRTKELISHFWSGKHHKTVIGINLVTFYYTDPLGRHMPVNFRIVDKSEGKTKNVYFREMLAEVLEWGLQPAFVTGDSWYSCSKNLKTVKKHQTGFMFAVEKNRLVALEKNQWQQARDLEVPHDGLEVWLKNFGFVRLFRTKLKDQFRHYVVYQPESKPECNREKFEKIHDNHWLIEQYHRAIKQVCHIERFQVRNAKPVRNHIFASLLSFVYLQKMLYSQLFVNIYQFQNDIYKDIVGGFVQLFSKGKDYLLPQMKGADNA